MDGTEGESATDPQPDALAPREASDTREGSDAGERPDKKAQGSTGHALGLAADSEASVVEADSEASVVEAEDRSRSAIDGVQPVSVEPGTLDLACPIHLLWLPAGDRLLVGGAWLLDPKTGARQVVRLPARSMSGGGSHVHHAISISPSGKSAVVLERAAFRFDSLTGSFDLRVPIPDLLGLGDIFAAQTVVLALSDRRVYLGQSPQVGGQSPQCRIWDASTRGFVRPRSGCLHGEFSTVEAIDAGPGDLFVVSSSGEGHPDAVVVRWDPRLGQRSTTFPHVDQYPYGSLTVHPVSADEALFVTTCDLGAGPRPCETGFGEAATDRLSLFRWRRSKGFIAVRTDLPSGAVPDPSGRRIAWVRGGEICVAAVEARPDASRCWPLVPTP